MPKTSRKTGVLKIAQGAAHVTPQRAIDSDLAKVVELWPELPRPLDDMVLALGEEQRAAAIAVADEGSGEAVKLFVVRSDEAIDEDAIRSYCKENLTGYKRPRIIEFRDELPKSAVGKVLRRELRG